MAFAFSLSAEIERNLISQRTKEALHRLRADGKKIGRQKGHSNKHHLLDDEQDKLVDMVNAGYKKLYIARYFNVSVSTVYAALQRLNKNS